MGRTVIPRGKAGAEIGEVEVARPVQHKGCRCLANQQRATPESRRRRQPPCAGRAQTPKLRSKLQHTTHKVRKRKTSMCNEACVPKGPTRNGKVQWESLQDHPTHGMTRCRSKTRYPIVEEEVPCKPTALTETNCGNITVSTRTAHHRPRIVTRHH